MLLGPRCNEMLPNRLQCPNVVEGSTQYCRVHNLLQKAANVAAAKAAEAKAESESV